jgi:hypothetical protein
VGDLIADLKFQLPFSIVFVGERSCWEVMLDELEYKVLNSYSLED